MQFVTFGSVKSQSAHGLTLKRVELDSRYVRQFLIGDTLKRIILWFNMVDNTIYGYES